MFSRFIDQLNQKIGEFSSWVLLYMVLATFAVVVLRYVFGVGWIWFQESVTYAHGMLFLLLAALTLQKDGHVRVDIFYSRASERKKRWVDLIGNLFFLLPFSLVLLFQSFPYVFRSWEILEGSKQTGGLDFAYIQKTFILIFCAMLSLQAIGNVVKLGSELFGKHKDRAG